MVCRIRAFVTTKLNKWTVIDCAFSWDFATIDGVMSKNSIQLQTEGKLALPINKAARYSSSGSVSNRFCCRAILAKVNTSSHRFSRVLLTADGVSVLDFTGPDLISGGMTTMLAADGLIYTTSGQVAFMGFGAAGIFYGRPRNQLGKFDRLTILL